MLSRSMARQVGSKGRVDKSKGRAHPAPAGTLGDVHRHAGSVDVIALHVAAGAIGGFVNLHEYGGAQ